MHNNTPEHFARAARFYDGSPTGQYDDEAAHALRCHHELLEALIRYVEVDKAEGCTDNNLYRSAAAAIAKATKAAL